jgi:Flp pilus assembly pilin Flp
MLHRLHRARGASMVEYALLIIAIMLLAAVGYRKLGKQVRMNADESSGELAKRGG